MISASEIHEEIRGLIQRQQFEQAVGRLAEIKADGFDDLYERGVSWMWLAKGYLDTGEKDGETRALGWARDCFKKSLQLNGDHARVHYYVGLLSERNGHDRKAFGVLQVRA